MIFRIVLTSLFTMLMITPLQADWKKATISKEDYAGKRTVDSENEENGEEPVEGNSILFAKARIAAEHDSILEGQIPGTEFKAFGRIRGIAPNDDYNGYWSISLKAWKDRLDIPERSVNKWEGDYEYENEEKDKDNFTKLKPLADFLSRCTATSFIIGGDNYHYWNQDDFYYQLPPYAPDLANAYADDFSHARCG